MELKKHQETSSNCDWQLHSIPRLNLAKTNNFSSKKLKHLIRKSKNKPMLTLIVGDISASVGKDES